MSPSDGRMNLSWDDLVDLSERLADMAESVQFDVLLAVSRGGLIPAALIAQKLGRRELEMAAVASYTGEQRESRLEMLSFPRPEALRDRRVLIVDDVWDSGRTAIAVRKRVARSGGVPIIAVLHYKPGASKYPDDHPDLVVERTEAWIVYPWERLGD